MSTAVKFILFQLMIFLPFSAGMVLRKRISGNQTLSGRIIRMNLVFIEPLIALWSIWGLDFRWAMVVLPLSGLLITLTGMILGRAGLTIMPLEGRSRASFLISSSIANHGFTMGAFICYIFFGEEGLGLAFLFLSYFLPYVFTVIFPYARTVSSMDHRRVGIMREYVLDIRNMPLVAVIVALVFQAAGISRPKIFFPVDILMMLSISAYYLSTGMNFITESFSSYLKENLMLCFIKFLAVPVAVASILTFIELGHRIESVILIQSFMPAAIYSVLTSVLFNLDTKLSTNLFVVNTLVFLILVLPLLFSSKPISSDYHLHTGGAS